MGCASHCSPFTIGPGAELRSLISAGNMAEPREPKQPLQAPTPAPLPPASATLCQPQSCPCSQRPHPVLAGGCRATGVVLLPTSVITPQSSLEATGMARCRTSSSNVLRCLADPLQVPNQLLAAKSYPGGSQKMFFFPLKMRQWGTWSLPRSKPISQYSSGRRKQELGL